MSSQECFLQSIVTLKRKIFNASLSLDCRGGGIREFGFVSTFEKTNVGACLPFFIVGVESKQMQNENLFKLCQRFYFFI